MTRSTTLGLGALALFTMAACSGDGRSREDIVIPILTETVPTRFDDFTVTVGEIEADIDAWCDSSAPPPTATIEQALTTWYALKPFWFGPVMERRSQFVVNFPADPVGIDELLASTDAVDADSLRDFVGADKRGLTALEYIVAGTVDTRRCDYAKGVAGLISSEAEIVADEWSTFGPDFVTDKMTANDALREIVSNSVFAVREAGKDGAPALERGLLDGARWAVLGDDTSDGIAPLLDDATVTRLTDEFDRDDAAAAEATLATDVIAQLGITLNFSDADGDG